MLMFTTMSSVGNIGNFPTILLSGSLILREIWFDLEVERR